MLILKSTKSPAQHIRSNDIDKYVFVRMEKPFIVWYASSSASHSSSFRALFLASLHAYTSSIGRWGQASSTQLNQVLYQRSDDITDDAKMAPTRYAISVFRYASSFIIHRVTNFPATSLAAATATFSVLVSTALVQLR
jgi:hypothetical protein